MYTTILKKGVVSINISDKLTFSTVFAQSFTLLDDIEKNVITLSLDLNHTYKGSKHTNTYMDIERLDEDWSILTCVDISNQQVEKRLIHYLRNRKKKPEKFYVQLIAKNQIVREITFEKSMGLKMTVIE